MRLLPLLAGFALIFAFALPSSTHATHAGPLTASCTNPEVGYTVNFPNNWFYNLRIAGTGAAQDIPACSAFSPNDFSLTPGSEPTGIAIFMSRENQVFDASQGEQVTVGGRDAVRFERESTTPGFEGTFYTYLVDLGDGTRLSAQTSDRFVGPYEENKQILDAMMDTMVFGAAQPSPTSTATATPTETIVPDAALPATGTGGGSGALLALLGVLLLTSGTLSLALNRRAAERHDSIRPEGRRLRAAGPRRSEGGRSRAGPEEWFAAARASGR